LKSRISNLKSRIIFRRSTNLKVVVLSVVATAIFWIFVALGKPYDTTIGYPVSWQFDYESFIVVDELPDKININVHGLGWNLVRASYGFNIKPIPIILNNPAASKKLAGVSLTNRVDNELEDLKLNYIFDDTLRLNIDQRGTRSFGIYVDSVNILLEENYRIISPITCDVDLMELEGPLSMLKNIQSDSFMVNIKEQQINSDFDEQIEFEIDRPELFLFRPKSVHVSFTVAEFVEAERQLFFDQLNFPKERNIYIGDSLCKIQFLVRKDLEPMVSADSFRVVADFSRASMLDSTLMLDIENIPPEALEVRLVQPQVRLLFNQ